jgi:cytochrome c biogenesis protein CcmG/thiol:disulfide interchange protein DsbE
MSGNQELNSSSVPLESQVRSPRWGAIAAWTALFILLILLGLGLIRRGQGQLPVGSEIPDFVLTTFEGQEIAMADLSGQVVVINFWASWCSTCDEEAAELEEAYQIYRDRGVAFLGVDYSDTDRAALAYLERYGVTYPNGPDIGTRISQAFRIRAVPETYFVGPDGILAARKIGPFLSLQEIVDTIERVLEG